MQSPLLSLDAYNIHRHVQRPRIDPEPRIDARRIDLDVPRASGNSMQFTMAYPAPRTNSDASGIAPSTTELDDVASNVSSQAPYNEYEDIVSVQFSSICSPFLATTHVPCSQAGHIRTTPH